MLIDGEKQVLDKQYYVVKPDGFQIPLQSTKVHGITTEYAIEHGEPLEKVMSEFLSALNSAEVVVAHNLEFDRSMVKAECSRSNIGTKANIKTRLCTMESSVEFCSIPFPSGSGFKWPRLEELYHKLFDELLEGAHNALTDVEGCSRCFFELVDRGIIAV